MPKVPAETRPIDRFKQQIKAAMPTVMRMLPAHVTPEAFEARVVTAVANKPELLQCDSASLLKACAEAAELGISLNPHLGEAWILKIWNGRLNDGKGGNEAQLRLGFIGTMKLARQSGEITQIVANLRYSKDEWVMSMAPPDLRHIAADGDRGDVVGAYCWWKLKDGTAQFEYMPADEIEKIKDRTKSRNQQGAIVGPWVTDEMEMWRKTTVRRARKYMPQSPQMERFHEAMQREAAEEYGEEPLAGDFVDVTDATATPAPATAPAKTQADKLAAKVASAPAVIRLEVPEDFDGPDYEAWADAAASQLIAMTDVQKKAWLAAHEDILGIAPAAITKRVRGA